MAVTAKNREAQIEEAIQTLLDAEDYVIDNDLDVRLWFDVDEEVEGRQIIVHANSASPSLMDETGNAMEWEIKIDILSYIHNSEDETPNDETDTLYQFLTGFAEQVTIAEIEAELTDLTINGKNMNSSAEEYDERFYTKVASMTIFVQ